MWRSTFSIAIFCYFLTFFIFNIKADVCNQLTTNVQIISDTDESSMYNWTAQFTINQSSDGYKMYIKKGDNNSVDPTNIYANESIGADYDWRKWGPCTVDANGCYWITKAGEFSPYLVFTTGFETLENLYVMHTYVDEGYFSETHGMVFTKENNYYDYNVDYGDYRAMYQVTCDNYIPVQPTVTPSQTCTIFSLNGAIYDTTQNYKIITSLSSVVNVSNNFGFITGIANGPDDLIAGIYMNAEVEALQLYDPMNYRHNQTISVLPDTNRYVFSWWQMANIFPDAMEFGTGKLLLRNGISYFEEGKAVTESDDCIFNSATLSKQYVGTSSFCCDVFEDVKKPVKDTVPSRMTHSFVESTESRQTPRSQKFHLEKNNVTYKAKKKLPIS